MLPGALSSLAAESTALVDDHGTLTAGALGALIGTEQRWLVSHDIRRCALLAANGRAWAIADLALLESGCVNIPLPQHFSAAQLHHALRGCDAVLCDDPARIHELDCGYVIEGTSPASGLTLMRRTMADATIPALPAGTVKITYTSGSTADPKGVCLTRGALDTVAQAVATVGAGLGIRRHLALLPLATLLENVAGLYAAWRAGAACHLPSATAGAIAGNRLTPALLLEEVTRCQPESLILVPELLRLLVIGAESGWVPPQSLRFIAVGGARVAPQLIERAAAVALPVYEGYGLSECASVVCLNTPEATRRGSVGRPLPHVRLRIDAQGEIHVAGAIMAGYVDTPAAALPTEIATGDLGEIDADGYVHVRGRIKNLFINSWGRNLSPEWIESELTQEDAIAQAIVCGEAQPRCVALLVPTHSGIPSAAITAAVARANARLPDYARVARFALLPERPTIANGLLTGNGRPRRQRIVERHTAIIEQLQNGASP